MSATSPHISAIILAAGRSSRMAPRNKLLIRLPCGTPTVAKVAAECCASDAADVIIVLGHQSAAVEQAVRDAAPHPKIRFITAAAYQKGLSASLREGIAALPLDADAALICLADMPLVSAEPMTRLMAAYTSSMQHPIVVPVWQGRQGNPVLWDRRFFAEICALTGDAGARALLQRHSGDIVRVAAESNAVLIDFDTPESLQAPQCPQAMA